jgi:hypothetical protein
LLFTIKIKTKVGICSGFALQIDTKPCLKSTELALKNIKEQLILFLNIISKYLSK